MKVEQNNSMMHILSCFRFHLLWSRICKLFNNSLLCGQWRISHNAPCWQCHGDTPLLWFKGHTSGSGMLQWDWLWPPTTCVCGQTHAWSGNRGVWLRETMCFYIYVFMLVCVFLFSTSLTLDGEIWSTLIIQSTSIWQLCPFLSTSVLQITK